MTINTVIAILVILSLALIYFTISFLFTKGGANAFWDKFVKKTLWIWLPFYALQRLVKEVILKKK